MTFKYLELRRIFPYLIALPVLLSAGCELPESTAKVIQNSGNEIELQKVVAYYRQGNDDRKLRALFFLIDNMQYKVHPQGQGVNNYASLLDSLSNTPTERKEWLEHIFDSLKVHSNIHIPGSFHYNSDLATIRSQDLIEHIDGAFKAWNYPWAKSLTFEQFCHYLLPYKIVDENPMVWNTQVQDKFENLTDSLKGVTDPYAICLAINAQLKQTFKIRSVPTYWDLDFNQLDKIRSGKCYQATQYTTYIMRALGLPVTMDFTPYWGNMNGGHEWNALIYNGKPIPFVGSESDPGKTKIDLAMQRKRGKVFRRTYEIQQNSLLFLTQGSEEIPQLFKNYHMEDVTKEYIPVSDIDLDLTTVSSTFKYVFLAVFNRQEWTPIDWAENNNNKGLFKNIGRGIAYLPVYYSEGNLIPAGKPFLLEQNGIVKFLNNTGKKEEVTIKRKGPRGPGIVEGNEYELLFWEDGWRNLGKKAAQADSITFVGVPQHSLLWIRSKDKSSNERIFQYENENQIWW